MKPIEIDVSDELYEELEDLACEENISVEKLVVSILEDELGLESDDEEEFDDDDEEETEYKYEDDN